MKKVEKNFMKCTKRKEYEKNWMKIVHKSVGTRIGEKYGVKKTWTIEDYRKNVPLTKFEDYKEIVDELMYCKEPKKFNYCSEEVTGFCKTSGTSGDQKDSIYTGYLREANRTSVLLSYSFQNLLDEWPKGYHMSYFHSFGVKTYENGLKKSTTTSMCLDEGENESFLNKLFDYLIDVSPYVCSLMNCSKWFYAYIALLNHDDLYILNPGAFISAVLELFQYMVENFDEFVDAVETGIIPKRIEKGENAENLKKVKKYFKKSPHVAKELRKLKDKHGLKVLQHIFPNLKYIFVSCSGANFSKFIPHVKDYFPKVQIKDDCYDCTEGPLGVAYKDHQFLPSCLFAFYEYIPYDDNDDETTVLQVNELEIGKRYEIVASYPWYFRYRIGDIIKVVGFVNDMPLFELCFRRGMIINYRGEKVDQQTINNVFLETIEFFKIPSKSAYQCFVKKKNVFYYNLVVEFDEEYKYVTTPDKYSQKFDELLQKHHYIYKYLIEIDYLRGINVEFLKPGTFKKIKDLKLKKGIQAKPLLMISDKSEDYAIMKSNFLK